MMDPGTDNHVVHSRGTLSALTGRFFIKPLAKALARVGAGAAWMPGGGLHGRPPLEEARPITSPSAVHGRGDALSSPCCLSSPCSLWSPCCPSSPRPTRPLAAQRKHLYLYPPPKPLPHILAFKLATTLVTLLTLLFSGYF